LLAERSERKECVLRKKRESLKEKRCKNRREKKNQVNQSGALNLDDVGKKRGYRVRSLKEKRPNAILDGSHPTRLENKNKKI